jgi:hypothetical protein
MPTEENAPHLINTSLPLTEQLRELEDYFAECLIDNADPRVLTQLWKMILAIRHQLNEPIYYHDTLTKEDRN